MRIAITGATGFLGKYLVDYLTEKSYNVLIIARPIEHAKNCFTKVVPIFETDYTTESLVNAFKDCNVVVHLATQTLQRNSDPLRVSNFLEVNVKITENILIAATISGIKRVYQTSSNNIYSTLNTLPFIEDAIPSPSSVYGLSKLYSEQLGTFISSKTGLEVINLRLARLFGFGERDSVVFTKYMKQAIQRDRLEVWGEGSTRIEYIYIKDVIDAIETAIRLNIPGGSYNLGTNKSYSVLDIAEIINMICSNGGNLHIDKSKPEGGYHILMDSSKFYKATNWRPKWSLEKGVREMYEYFMDKK